MYAIYDSPDQHPRIHDDELLTIKLNIGLNSSSGKRSNIPWTSIMTSMPVWAISVAKFCGAWGNLMLMSKLPSYLKSVLHLSIQDVGQCIVDFLFLLIVFYRMVILHQQFTLP